MKRLGDCLSKCSKLINREDADQLVKEAREIAEEEGLNPLVAAQRAVSNALEETKRNGDDILRQIGIARPQALAAATRFWNQQTVRPKGAQITPPTAPPTPTAPPAAAPPAAPAPLVQPELPGMAAPPVVTTPPTTVPPAQPEPAIAPEPEPQPAPEPEAVQPPLTEAQEEYINTLPEQDRAAAREAFTRDDTDPYADQERRRGLPVSRRLTREKAIKPEKNKMLDDAVKYGAFSQTTGEVMKNIANDSKQPKWIRLLYDLFLQLGLNEGVPIRFVNTPEAAWRGLYVTNHESGKGEILINLSHPKGMDLPRLILHEMMHHGTMLKLDSRYEDQLTPAELAAKEELQKIFDYIKSHPKFLENKELRDKMNHVGALDSLTEFVSEIFANDELRMVLNTIKPDGRISLLQRFITAIMKALVGDRAVMMRPGSLLEEAIGKAVKLSGNRRASTMPSTSAAAAENRARAARLANAFPNFQENIAAAAMNNMGIKEAAKRVKDPEAAFYSKEEQELVNADLEEWGKKIKATPAEIKDLKVKIDAYVRYYRENHPAKADWAFDEIKVLGLENKKGLTRSDPTKENPAGEIAFKVKFKDTNYTYSRDKDGNLIQRFLKPSKKSGRTRQEVNPEWTKRVDSLANKMFENLQGIMARLGRGDDDARVAQVIMDQIGWYRDMNERLRTEFGSMSDYVADVIAGFSPITDVPGNWNNFVEYFRHVMKGDYDEAFRKFDEYISADPKNRTSGTYKKEFPPEDFPDLWPRKLFKEDQPLFGANTGNALMAGLDIWRAIKSGTAPKARNFGLNLIGLSMKATIDRWAARYLQRMHAPTHRLPPKIEGEVKGEHMPGENVELVSGDFGMGQDVFEQVATRLRESGHEVFKNVTAADLQAILWFGEKEVWEMNGWTDIMGAGSSMNVVAQGTAAQRYEAGAPGKAKLKGEALAGETMTFRAELNKQEHVMGAKMVPSISVDDGKQSDTFDGEWIAEPEYDPENSVGIVARLAAKAGKKMAHISRVIVNRNERNPNATPGLHVFFKGRVGDADIRKVLDALKAQGINSGINLTVDPRVRPEVIKSLDPAAKVNQFNGVRVQFPYGVEGMTNQKMEDIFGEVIVSLSADKGTNVAESRVMYYDTLVLKKGVDYDANGKLTKSFSEGPSKAWAGRARSEGTAAATRRDDTLRAIADRKREDLDLESRMEQRERDELAAYEAFQRNRRAPDTAFNGGVDTVSAAAVTRDEDQTEPVKNPYGGRASLVQAMAQRLRDRAGVGGSSVQIPEDPDEVTGVTPAGSSTNKGGAGAAPVWRDLGKTFRRREADLYQGLGSATRLVKEDLPEGTNKFVIGRRLLDLLTGKAEADTPELRKEIAGLREEIPVVPAKVFEDNLSSFDAGVEADVYHDSANDLVYKLYKVSDEGKMGGYVIGPMRLEGDGAIRIETKGKLSVPTFLGRMERTVAHEGLTPQELVAVTPEGHFVYAQPFIAGRGVTAKNSPAALARAGIHQLSDIGAISGVAQLPDGRWVVYDDLHGGNVRTLPGGRVEIIDANNRELDSQEIEDLETLGKLRPPEKPAPKAAKPTKKAQRYSNATVVAPAVTTHHGTPHEWEPEVKVRFDDGSEEWVRQSSIDEVGGLKGGQKIIERAPAGRVRAEKVSSGEGHAAFGWGVLYSAARRGLAEHYRNILTEKYMGRGGGQWLFDGVSLNDYLAMREKFGGGDEYGALSRALGQVGTKGDMEENIDIAIGEFRYKMAHYKRIAEMQGEKGIFSTGANYAIEYQEMVDALEKYRDRIEFQEVKGNVYTVRLDVDDPELLDWFKPMKDQAWVIDKLLESYGITREEALKANEETEMLADLYNHAQSEYDRLEPGVARETEQAAIKRAKEAEARFEESAKSMASAWGSWLARSERMEETSYGKQRHGEDLYGFLTDQEGSPERASKALDAAGIPGIVFLDRDSRDLPSGEKTFNNYVIFNPELIKVIGKNGEVVHSVTEDIPAPGPAPQPEGPLVAAARSVDPDEVKDGTDLVVAPMAGRGKHSRVPIDINAYKAGGVRGALRGIFKGAPYINLTPEQGRIQQKKKSKEAEVAFRVGYLIQDFKRVLRGEYGRKGPDAAQNKDVMMILGNLDTRLTQLQADQAKQIKSTKQREAFKRQAHAQNVADFKVRQQAAEARVPVKVRDAAIKLREAIAEETKEARLDPGLDPDVRARLDANQDVFLHGNAFRHFENNAWDKYIRSKDPEAVRVRAAAEKLFHNEILAEKAIEYQQKQAKRGVKVNNADALIWARANTPDIREQVEGRLLKYLSKETMKDDRLHMLQGKMPVARNEAGKMIALDRENIPAEVRELWGQYDDPITNFAKTMALVANHNARVNMEYQMLAEGKAGGYFWQKGDPEGMRRGLVPMTSDTRGPMAGVEGPPLLKQALDNLGSAPVGNLMTELNRHALMFKTVGSIASAVRNFFGNPMFLITNGNFFASMRYWKGAFWTSLTRAFEVMADEKDRKLQSRLIELGVMDESVDANTVKRMAKDARWAAKWEKQYGFGSSVTAVMRKYAGMAARAVGDTFTGIYQMADNFWKVANYNVELARSKAINPSWSLEQHEERAAELTRKMLPTYSNIPDWIRESQWKYMQMIGPYFAFQLEAARTYASTWHQAGTELMSPNPREKASGAWRLTGLLAAPLLPFGLSMLAKWKFDYSDDDEEALRESLPEWQRNNWIIMLPKDKDGNYRFIDVNHMNPYSMWTTTAMAGMRANEVGEDAGPAMGWQFLKPALASQPVWELGQDLATNRDSRTKQPLFSPIASPAEQWAARASRVLKTFTPGTIESMAHIAEAIKGGDLPTGILGRRQEKTGEKRDLTQELMKVFPGAMVQTVDPNKAVHLRGQRLKKVTNAAGAYFNDTISTKGDLPDEVARVKEAYKRTDDANYNAFRLMRRHYKQLQNMGKLSDDQIMTELLRGFGTEARPGGLPKESLGMVVEGVYRKYTPSLPLRRDINATFPTRYQAFEEAYEATPEERPLD